MIHLSVILIIFLLLVDHLDLKLIFDGSASKEIEEVWKSLNTEGKGAIVDVSEDLRYGKVWKFTKPKGAKRAEGHGVKGFEAKEGSNVYIGWHLKLEQPPTLSTSAIFQWKAYGRNMKQNAPLKLRTVNGNFVLEHREGNRQVKRIWTSPIRLNEWTSFIFRLNVSRKPKKGYVELWYNGQKQTFSNGRDRFTGRTLEGQHTDPKWGSFGGENGEVTAYVSSIRIGTTFEDVSVAPPHGTTDEPPYIIHEPYSVIKDNRKR